MNPATVSGCDPVIEHDWGAGPSYAGVTANYFSVRWEADVSFTGVPMTFTMRSDDGIRLFLDDVKIFDRWTVHSERTDVLTLTVAAGTHTVRYEYFDAAGLAVAALHIAPASSPTTTTSTPPSTTSSTTTTTTTTSIPGPTPMIATALMPATGAAVDGVALDGADNVFTVASAQQQVFRSVFGVAAAYAGTGSNGFSGDGEAAVSAKLNSPSAIAATPSGELYIADNGNHRIRKVSVAGIISTVAGTGVNGSGGDGGAPLAASFKDITGLAVRPNGHLLVADRQARRVREIDFSGNVINTVFGNGTKKGGGNGLPAVSTGLDRPVDVSAYGTVFAVADDSTGFVWEVTPDGIAHYVAGGGSETAAGSLASQFAFDDLRSVAVRNDGLPGAVHDLLVVDKGSSRLWRIDRVTGRMMPYGGTGTAGNANFVGDATIAQLNNPKDVVSRPGGQYVADSGNDAVRKVTP